MQPNARRAVTKLVMEEQIGLMALALSDSSTLTLDALCEPP